MSSLSHDQSVFYITQFLLLSETYVLHRSRPDIARPIIARYLRAELRQSDATPLLTTHSRSLRDLVTCLLVKLEPAC
jgi:hypothetical protein